MSTIEAGKDHILMEYRPPCSDARIEEHRVNLRHLRFFVTLAEELHFGRAAERLHIEQSPLSRAIKKLESDAGARLLERSSRAVHLTWAGKVFLEDARRILLVIEQAKGNVRAAATGYRGRLRIAITDGIAQARLTALLALCREEEPDIEIGLFETSQPRLLKGLKTDVYDAGLALSDRIEPGVIAQSVWHDPMVVAIPRRHPLLAHRRVVASEVLNYPLVLRHPEACDGCNQQVERLLRSIDAKPQVAERVLSHDLMMTLVAAGYGVAFCSAAHLAAYRHPEVVGRPLAGPTHPVTTFLLRPDAMLSEQLTGFIDRATRIGSEPTTPGE